MMTAITFLVFFGFYCCYFASAKAVLPQHSALEIWLKQQRKVSKILGTLLLIASLIFHIAILGVATGTFSFVISLMVSGSMIVLLAPLKIVTFRSAVVIFVLALVFEISNII